MSNEKICPVYSASDNTARECIKEECGWWCDQRNVCAVVSASDSDITDAALIQDVLSSPRKYICF